MTHYGRLLQILVMAMLAFQTACNETATPATGGDGGTKTGDPITGTDPVGTVNDDAGFYIKVYNSDKTEYRLHKDFTVTSTDVCRIKKTDAVQDIQCVVDAPEEDLFFSGLKFQYNVPSDMCDYLHRTGYYYENFEVGAVSSGVPAARRVPAAVTVYIEDSLMGFGVDGGGDPNPATAAPAGIAGLNDTGAPICAFDYSKDDADKPNCCVGKTVVTTVTVDHTNGNTSSVKTIDWGGTPSQCLGGPALETQPLDKNGFPKTEISYVKGTGLNATLEPKTPIDAFSGVFSTLYLANFQATIPVGPHGLDSQNLPGYGKLSNQPYEWDCMDKASEVKARIRLYVREWNEYDEWQKLGDPDTGPAAEPSPFANNGVNDFSDWADILANYGGFFGIY